MKSEDIYGDSGSADPALLDKFERDFNIRLPSSYRELIQLHNVPYLRRNYFRFRNQHRNELWSYRLNSDGADSRDVTFFGFGDNLPDYEQIEGRQDFDVYGHDRVVAFGTAANGDHICFDYRHDPKTSEPHVVVMFHDAYGEDNKMLISHVANTFDEFLSALYERE